MKLILILVFLACNALMNFESHDALLIIPPIPISVIEQLPFEFGTWYAEMKIIFALLKDNYTVRNVWKSVRICHLHSTQVRHRLMPSEKYMPEKMLPIVLKNPVSCD